MQVAVGNGSYRSSEFRIQSSESRVRRSGARHLRWPVGHRKTGSDPHPPDDEQRVSIGIDRTFCLSRARFQEFFSNPPGALETRVWPASELRGLEISTWRHTPRASGWAERERPCRAGPGRCATSQAEDEAVGCRWLRLALRSWSWVAVWRGGRPWRSSSRRRLQRLEAPATLHGLEGDPKPVPRKSGHAPGQSWSHAKPWADDIIRRATGPGGRRRHPRLHRRQAQTASRAGSLAKRTGSAWSCAQIAQTRVDRECELWQPCCGSRPAPAPG